MGFLSPAADPDYLFFPGKMRSLRLDNGFARAAVACALASVVLFGFGATWLAQYGHLSVKTVLHVAVTPFLPGNAVKIAAAAGIFSSIDRWRRITPGDASESLR